MIDINIYESQTCKTVSFGRKGENLARRVMFDISALIAEFGAGSFEWVIRRPNESTVYIAVNKEQDGNTAILNLTTTETAISGYGGLELRYYVDDVIVKTIVWRTSIAASLGGGDVPDPIEDYIDQMREIAQDASESADAAGDSATQAAVSATNAAGSATEAAGYAANAAASAGAAADSATDSAESASAAHTSETNAANSATAAAGSETNAASSATSAATAAANAGTSETAAAGSASAASTSAAQAAASATAADRAAQDIAAAATQIETNRTDITELKNAIEMTDITLDATSGKYVNANGGLSNGSAFRYTATATPIKAGDTVHFVGRGYSTTVAMIYLCDSQGESRKPVVMSLDASKHDYTYTAVYDGYVGFSWHSGITPKVYIVSDELGGNNQSRFITDEDIRLSFQLGSINVSPTGFTYVGNANRIRTYSNYWFELKKGDIVGLTDYTDARISVVAKLTDGTYKDFSWKTADYVIQEDGDYQFIIANLTDTDQNGYIYPLGSLFFCKWRDNIPKIKKQMPYYASEKVKNLYDPNLIPAKRRIVMHRGFMAQAPENTIPAFQLAGQGGAWGIETDVRITSDGYLVCFHDDTVDRMTDGSGALSTKTLAEVEALTIDAGSNISQYPNLKIPSFSEYLKVCRKYGCVAILDVSSGFNQSHISAMASEIQSCGMQKSCLILCNASTQVSYFNRYLPDVTCVKVVFATNNVAKQQTEANFLKMGLAIESTAVTEEIVKTAHATGYPVISFIGNTQSEIDALFDLGVDVVESNAISTV